MAVTGIVNSLIKKTEPFQNNENLNNNSNSSNSSNSPKYGQMVVLLIMVILWLALVLLVGKYLWNECLCKLVTVCKPVDNVFTLLGLIVLLDIIRPNIN